ncbi:MAG: hypothetical protein WBA76_17305 [Phormidesmis sp.]
MTAVILINRIDRNLVDPDLEIARHYLTDLSKAIASGRSYAAAILPLKVKLENAVCDYEASHHAKAASADCFEDGMAKRSDLLWLCNQCKYYLSASHRANDGLLASIESSTEPDRGLWQVRRAFLAIAFLKLIAFARNWLPGSKVVSLSRQDIWPGIRLWYK